MWKAKFKTSVRSVPASAGFVLGVSMGSRNHVGGAFRAVVQCLNAAHFEGPGVIDVSDTLARYRHRLAGASKEEAWERARQSGAQWVHDNRSSLGALRKPHVLIHWERWLQDPRFVPYRGRFRRALARCSALSDAIDADIERFAGRRDDDLLCDRSSEAYALSVEFYLEELAVMSIQFEDHPGALQVYPGKQLHCLKAVRAGRVPDVPGGIPSSRFCRVNVYEAPAQEQALDGAVNRVS